jgi:Xaa-Pro aminopeptidase
MKKLPVPLSEYRERIRKCQQEAKKEGLEALLVFSHSPDRPGHVRYLSNYYAPISFNSSSLPGHPIRRGIPDTSILVPIEDDPVLIKASKLYSTDYEIAISDVREYRIYTQGKDLIGNDLTEAVESLVREKGLENSRIGIAGEDVISAYLMRLIKEKLPDVRFVYADHMIEGVRQVKSKNEINLMRKTGELADKALKAAVEAVRPGVREQDVAAVAAATFLREGAERILFNDVQSGSNTEKRATWPMAGDRVIQEDDIVMIDLGAQDANGYWLDVARTVVAGKASKPKRDLLRLSREATDYVAQIAMPGMNGIQWLEKTNDFIDQRIKTGEYSIPHPEQVPFVGHSMGLDMEALWFVPGAQMELKEGLVISIEPWIHVPGLGASRFEDLTVITSKGGEFLMNYRYDI